MKLLVTFSIDQYIPVSVNISGELILFVGIGVNGYGLVG